MHTYHDSRRVSQICTHITIGRQNWSFVIHIITIHQTDSLTLQFPPETFSGDLMSRIVPQNKHRWMQILRNEANYSPPEASESWGNRWEL